MGTNRRDFLKATGGLALFSIVPSKVLGGPKRLSDAQVQRLYEIRRQFGLKGKHPANVCPNAQAGKPSCHGCGGSCKGNCSGAGDDVVAEITKKVLEQMGK